MALFSIISYIQLDAAVLAQALYLLNIYQYFNLNVVTLAKY